VRHVVHLPRIVRYMMLVTTPCVKNNVFKLIITNPVTTHTL